MTDIITELRAGLRHRTAVQRALIEGAALGAGLTGLLFLALGLIGG